MAEHSGAIVGPRSGVIGTLLKPDILNLTTVPFTFGEIKPLSLSGIARGLTQMAAYDQALTAAGLLRGWTFTRETWPLGVRKADVFGESIAYFNVGGLVFYTDMAELSEELVEITSVALAREFIR